MGRTEVDIRQRFSEFYENKDFKEEERGGLVGPHRESRVIYKVQDVRGRLVQIKTKPYEQPLSYGKFQCLTVEQESTTEVKSGKKMDSSE